ncbi:hypothetical protein CKO51_03475 [Rhodopirellula sp. SM50]|nr:hypothetical protein [Rhodopirellula sp. SM50]PAY20948.1 hypothetical protein CKO51_03475 [Rhodopirellula sp. SM50]
MKQTVFEIETHVTDGEPTKVIGSIRENLLAIKNVLSIDVSVESTFASFKIAVEFEDGAQAKTLHRKIMKALMSSDRISIRQVTTKLNDIF